MVRNGTNSRLLASLEKASSLVTQGPHPCRVLPAHLWPPTLALGVNCPLSPSPGSFPHIFAFHSFQITCLAPSQDPVTVITSVLATCHQFPWGHPEHPLPSQSYFPLCFPLRRLCRWISSSLPVPQKRMAPPASELELVVFPWGDAYPVCPSELRVASLLVFCCCHNNLPSPVA